MTEVWVEFGSLVHAIPDPAVVLEFQGGEPHIIVANAAAAAAFGEPVEAILGTGYAPFYAPERREWLRREIRQVVDTGISSSFEEVRELPLGRLVLETCLTPLPEGRVLAIGRNVSARDAAAKRAAELERLTDTGTWSWNLEHDTVSWSRELCRVLDLPEDVDPARQTALVRIHPDDRQEVQRTFDEVRRTGRSAEIEYRSRRRDGTFRRILARAGLVRDADGVAVRLFGTVQDVTERHRLQRREQEASSASRQLDRALQLNDDVVQALARATLALDLGLLDDVRHAVEDGTLTVRAIMRELVRGTTVFGDGLRPGDLRRRREAAQDAVSVVSGVEDGVRR